MLYLIQLKAVDMRWYIECNGLEDACKKIFRMSRMVAMFPLSDDCRFLMKFLIAPTIVFFLLSAQSVYWVVGGKTVLNEYKSVYHIYLHVFRKLSTTISCILIFSQLILEKDKFSLILDNLKIIDSELEQLNKGPIMILSPFRYLLNTFLSICLVLVQSMCDPAVYWMQEHMETVLVAVFINQIIAFCDLLRYSLEQISVYSYLESNKNYALRTRIYNLIEECAENLNDSYGMGMLFIIIIFFVTILHQSYQYYNKTLTTPMQISNGCLTTAGDLWFIVQLILAGSSVTSKVIAELFQYNSMYSIHSITSCISTSRFGGRGGKGGERLLG